MEIITSKKLTETEISKFLSNYIKTRLHKTKQLLILYLIIIIIGCIFVLFSPFNNQILSAIVFIIVIMAFSMLYDTLKELITLYNFLKNSNSYTKKKGILLTKNKNVTSKKNGYFIDDKKLVITSDFNKTDLDKYLDKKVTVYFIDKYAFLISIK